MAVDDDAYVDPLTFDDPVMAPNEAALRGQIRMMISSFSDSDVDPTFRRLGVDPTAPQAAPPNRCRDLRLSTEAPPMTAHYRAGGGAHAPPAPNP